MKCLHIIDSFGLGGAQTVVKGIFEKQKENKDIFLFVLRKRDITTKISHKNKFICTSKAKYSFKPIKELRKVIKENNIEILHCHLFRSQVFGWILKKIYFPNIKLIIHEHGQIFQKDWHYNQFMKIAQKQADLFIAVSNATKKELIDKANISKNKIKILYNFVDLDKFNRINITGNIEKEREKIGIKKDEYVIGFVGRLNKVKGCEYLIKALPYLKFKYKVLITGDGPEKEKLEKLCKKLNVENNIIFLSYREALEVYSILDCLIVPSIYESFGLSVIEAQACKIPVIASNLLSLNEIIEDGENGLLFKQKDEIDLVEKIMLIYNDKDMRDNIIEKGLKNVKKYSLDNYLVKLNIIYREILK